MSFSNRRDFNALFVFGTRCSCVGLRTDNPGPGQAGQKVQQILRPPRAVPTHRVPCAVLYHGIKILGFYGIFST